MIWRELIIMQMIVISAWWLWLKKGISEKDKLSIQYPNILWAIRPVPHGDDLPVPNPPEKYSLH